MLLLRSLKGVCMAPDRTVVWVGVIPNPEPVSGVGLGGGQPSVAGDLAGVGDGLLG
jgi:hypothetical protein